MLELHRNRAMVGGEKITKALKFQFGGKWGGAAEFFSAKVVERFAERLKKVRKEKNITQVTLSEGSWYRNHDLSELGEFQERAPAFNEL